jgi:hypothetical protein
MSVELSGEITAIATSVLAFFAIVTAAFAFLAFRKQSQEVRDQAEQLRLQREANVMQAEAFVRDRVFAILNGESGLRSVIALGDDDGKTGIRVKLLERTAEELDVAGAETLAEKLRKLLAFGEHGSPVSRTMRDEFATFAKQFMNVSSS